MVMTTHLFGKTKEGRNVTLFRLKNNAGMTVELLDYGCVIRSITLQDAAGGQTDVCLGYETIQDYEEQDGHFGAVIGRYANRIAGASFELNGITYPLYRNCGENTLHGGLRGFDAYVWDGSLTDKGVLFTRCSPNMEEGFPGSLLVGVSYELSEDNALSINYYMKAQEDTVTNLTNHAYFNLSGGGTVLDHELTIHSGAITECNDQCTTTGALLPVEGTAFDFRQPKAIGRDIGANDQQLLYGNGYDHNFVLDGVGLREVAVLTSPVTGITMKTYTTMPGVQLYTSNSMGERVCKGGVAFGPREAVCLETQYFPDSLHHPSFPTSVLKKGEVGRQQTIYAFSAAKK